MFSTPILDALCLVGVISGVPLAASAAAGLVVATVQAATQIQDQTVGYLVKLVTVGGLLFIFRQPIEEQLVSFLRRMFGGVEIVGRM